MLLPKQLLINEDCIKVYKHKQISENEKYYLY